MHCWQRSIEQAENEIAISSYWFWIFTETDFFWECRLKMHSLSKRIHDLFPAIHEFFSSIHDFQQGLFKTGRNGCKIFQFLCQRGFQFKISSSLLFIYSVHFVFFVQSDISSNNNFVITVKSKQKFVDSYVL